MSKKPKKTLTLNTATDTQTRIFCACVICEFGLRGMQRSLSGSKFSLNTTPNTEVEFAKI